MELNFIRLISVYTMILFYIYLYNIFFKQFKNKNDLKHKVQLINRSVIRYDYSSRARQKFTDIAQKRSSAINH